MAKALDNMDMTAINTVSKEGSGSTYFSKNGTKRIKTRADYILTPSNCTTMFRGTKTEAEKGFRLQGNAGLELNDHIPVEY